MKAAMISYNTFVKGVQNGWKRCGDNNLLLLQNETGETWGAPQSSSTRQVAVKKTQTMVLSLWEQLREEIPTIDKFIMYVGGSGAERVIELSSQQGLKTKQTIFVLCDCFLNKKKCLLANHGFESSPVIMCECGGHKTMRKIYDSLLTHERLPEFI